MSGAPDALQRLSPRSSREKRRRYPQEASPSNADMTQQHQARRQTEPAGEQVADPRYPQDRAEVAEAKIKQRNFLL